MPVKIISFDADAKPTSKECPAEIIVPEGELELVAMVMQKYDFHAVALVKYQSKWILYDSLQSEKYPKGQELGQELDKVISAQSANNYYPYMIFYQKK